MENLSFRTYELSDYRTFGLDSRFRVNLGLEIGLTVYATIMYSIYILSNLVMWVTQLPKQKYITLNLFMNN